MIKTGLFLAILISLSFLSHGQDPDEDYSWWNELHDWEPGDPGWRNWIRISPGYLGPNALPVPKVKKGIIEGPSTIEITASGHFHKGDPTQDISGRLFIPFAEKKVAIEIYGVVFEHFSFSEQVRNERFARDRDGKGTAMGDLYFSTLIQLLKNRKFPNTLFRFATKTASGNQLAAARYSDSPGYFFDLSFSKNYPVKINNTIKPFIGFGFYSWQTNDELRLQNDALMYSGGADLEIDKWSVTCSLSGYSGYKNERDRPVQLNFAVNRDLKMKAIKLQYHHGLRHWGYKTVRVSFAWRLNNVR